MSFNSERCIFHSGNSKKKILFYYILNVAKSEHISLYTCAQRKQRLSNVSSQFILCSLLGAASISHDSLSRNFFKIDRDIYPH